MFIERLTEEQVRKFIEDKLMANFGVEQFGEHGIKDFRYLKEPKDWKKSIVVFFSFHEPFSSNYIPDQANFTDYSSSFFSDAWIKYLYSIFGEKYKEAFLKDQEERLFS